MSDDFSVLAARTFQVWLDEQHGWDTVMVERTRALIESIEARGFTTADRRTLGVIVPLTEQQQFEADCDTEIRRLVHGEPDEAWDEFMDGYA